MQFVVISGCSGGGKSTLLAELRRRGHNVVEEPGRRIIARKLEAGGSALPWIDAVAFARRAIEMSLQDRAQVAGLRAGPFSTAAWSTPPRRWSISLESRSWRPWARPIVTICACSSRRPGRRSTLPMMIGAMTSLTRSLNMSGYAIPMIHSAMQQSSFRKSATQIVPIWSWNCWGCQTTSLTATYNPSRAVVSLARS